MPHTILFQSCKGVVIIYRSQMIAWGRHFVRTEVLIRSTGRTGILKKNSFTLKV
jgi:hypothetical protein